MRFWIAIRTALTAAVLAVAVESSQGQCANVLSVAVTGGTYHRGQAVPISFCTLCAGPQNCLCQLSFTASACGVLVGSFATQGAPGVPFCAGTNLVLPSTMPYGTFTICASTTCALGCVSLCDTCCECCSCSETSITVTPAAGDTDGNGHVNTDDLLTIINAWGPCPAPPAPCPFDIAPPGGDGVVNQLDLAVIIANWG